MARSAAVDDPDGVVAALDSMGPDPASIARMLTGLHLGELAAATLRRAGVEHPVADHVRAFLAGLARPRATPAELLDAYREVDDTLGRLGVAALLLKGAAFAERLYAGIDRRPQHDLDVLVRRADATRARRALSALGYRRRNRDRHSTTLARGAVVVDLHHAARSAPAFALDESVLWRDPQELTIAGTPVRTLGDEASLTLLTVSLVEDVAFGMVKLRSALDTWLLARAVDGAVDWEAWFAARAAERAEVLAVNGFALAVRGLDVAGDVPRLAAAMDRRAALVRVRSRAHALELLTAPRRSSANMAWFATVYPGSLRWFQAHSFVHGLPRSAVDELRRLRR